MEGSNGLLIVAFFLIAAGFFQLGRLWEDRKVCFWREQWVIAEYKLAKLEGREPEDIDGCKL